jgi:uncharacterized membrane protein YtjA (UPF0391 family)
MPRFFSHKHNEPFAATTTQVVPPQCAWVNSSDQFPIHGTRIAIYLGRDVIGDVPIHALGRRRRINMLSWALTFLIIALVAALLGFGVVAGTAAWIAKVLFVVFLILFVVSLIAGRRAPL